MVPVSYKFPYWEDMVGKIDDAFFQELQEASRL